MTAVGAVNNTNITIIQSAESETLHTNRLKRKYTNVGGVLVLCCEDSFCELHVCGVSSIYCRLFVKVN